MKPPRGHPISHTALCRGLGEAADPVQLPDALFVFVDDINPRLIVDIALFPRAGRAAVAAAGELCWTWGSYDPATQTEHDIYTAYLDDAWTGPN